jgi:guanylate kinase
MFSPPPMVHPPREVHGLLVLISGPPGTGKAGLCRRLVAAHPDIERILTCTTRAPRPGEQHGVDYCFLSAVEFDQAVAHDEFFEWTEAGGARFGTRKDALNPKFACEVDMVISVDVRGARAYRQALEGNAAMRSRLVQVFVMPPGAGTIQEPQAVRGEDPSESPAPRPQASHHEMEQWTQHDYCIVTGSPDEDFARLEAIWRAEKCRVARLRQAAIMQAAWMRAESQAPFAIER